MDSYEINKIVGAILGSVLLIFGVGTVADVIYATHTPETAAYIVEGAEETGGQETAAEKPAEVPISQMMASADASKGQAQMKKCSACHTWDKGGKNKIGPNLHGVLGRAAGSLEGFKYSSAMQSKAAEIGVWNYDNLSEFLAAPKKFLKGTSMAFAGVKKASQRADLLMFLREQSDSPVALPEAAAAEPAATEPAAAEPVTADPSATTE